MSMQKIEPLNEKEKAWINKQVESAASFIERFSPIDSARPLTLGALDRAFAIWLASNPANPELINEAINSVGMAFGQALVDGIGLKWVVATDDRGTDLAVHGLPGNGDVLIYPANFVAKRWERRETGFLEDAYQRIVSDIDMISRERQSSRTT
jgi:hypothetical protein